MTDTERTWTVLSLAVLILLLVLWLYEKHKKETVNTQTSVNLGGQVSQFPVRNEQYQPLLRQCTYDNGHVLTLDPAAVGGQCAPYFTDLQGNTGALVSDTLITVPEAGQSTVNTQAQGGA